MRLYYGTYGHHLSGKMYVYWGDDNLRTGQQVVAPVTNKRSGKTYNTMFTIGRTQSEKNAEGEVGRLNSKGIFIKTLGGTEVLTLPGGKSFDTKRSWKQESETRYRTKHNLPKISAEEPQTTAGKPSVRRDKEAVEQTVELQKIKPRAPKKKAKTKRKKSVASLLKTSKKSAQGFSEASAALKKRNQKVAADSFTPKERLKKKIQREAFVLDNDEE